MQFLASDDIRENLSAARRSQTARRGEKAATFGHVKMLPWYLLVEGQKCLEMALFHKERGSSGGSLENELNICLGAFRV